MPIVPGIFAQPKVNASLPKRDTFYIHLGAAFRSHDEMLHLLRTITKTHLQIYHTYNAVPLPAIGEKHKQLIVKYERFGKNEYRATECIYSGTKDWIKLSDMPTTTSAFEPNVTESFSLKF